MLDCLDGAFAATGRIIGKVTPDRLGDPTPCTAWDVRALINHITGVLALMAATASGAAPPKEMPTDWVGTDPAAIFEEAARATLAAWSQPGALDGTCRLPNGLELPAIGTARRNFIDTLVHGWDLAQALGLDATLDPALAAAALEASHEIMSEDLRGVGKPFAPVMAVAEGAPPGDQLLAFLGRHP